MFRIITTCRIKVYRTIQYNRACEHTVVGIGT